VVAFLPFGSCQRKVVPLLELTKKKKKTHTHDKMLLGLDKMVEIGFPALKLYVHLLVCTQKKKESLSIRLYN
jgi:hypothetical protein